MKKDKPILFTADMLKASDEGRKTCTRRIIKDQDCVEFHEETGEFIHIHSKDCQSFCDFACEYKYPYQPGDHLWIKQNFQIETYSAVDRIVSGMRDDDSRFTNIRLTDREWLKFIKWKKPFQKKSKLFMFKSLAYKWLEVTNVRVERVNEISLEDIRKEGLSFAPDCDGSIMKTEWKNLWNKINEKRGYPYNSGCFVLVIEFKKI